MILLTGPTVIKKTMDRIPWFPLRKLQINYNKAKHSDEVKIVVSGVVIVYEYTLLSRGFFCRIPCTYQ